MPPALSDTLVGWASGPVARSTASASPPSPRAKRPQPKSALEALLVDLGPQIQRGASISAPHERGRHETPADPSHVCATGLTALDIRLGGGFPRGHLSEICGPPSSGRTALALNLIATALQQGHLTGWIDLADAFDPLSASDSGVALDRLLWVRPRSNKEALQSCDRLLQTEGFELIIFDCVSDCGSGRVDATRGRNRIALPAPSISDVAWLRLSRLAARTRTALVVLSRSPDSKASPFSNLEPSNPEFPSSVTGSRSAILLEMLPLGARFAHAPNLLESLETTAILRRHRTRPSGSETPLSARVAAQITHPIEPQR